MATSSTKATLFAVAAVSLLTALVLVVSTSQAYAPSRSVLQQASQQPVHKHARMVGLDEDYQQEEDDLDKEMAKEGDEDEDEEPNMEEEFEEPTESETDEPDEDLEDEEPEDIEEHEHHHIFHALAHYASLHPVFKRCMAHAKMPMFAHEIMKSCGNIHELDSCAYPCWRAMTMYSDHVGCCFETVMQGYRHLDVYAYHAWRHWQGTLSGKCGITFESDSCGESVGEKPFRDLSDKVKHLEREAKENQDTIDDLTYPYMYFSNGYYYGDKMWPRDGHLRPTHWKQHQGHKHGKTSLHGKHGHASLQMKAGDDSAAHQPLGDEVFDMPVSNGEDMGDVHVPSEKLQPYMFASTRQMHEKAEAEHDEAEAEAEEEDDGSHRTGSMKTPKGQQLSNAYDEYRNYQNQLRLKEAYDKIKADPSRVANNPYFQVPGEAWQKTMPQSLHSAEGGKPFDLAHGIVQASAQTKKLQRMGVNV